MSVMMKEARMRTQGAGDIGADEGGFFSFLGGVAKSAIGLVPGVGPVAQAGLGLLGGRNGSRMPRVPVRQAPQVARPGVRARIERAVPGGRSGTQARQRMRVGEKFQGIKGKFRGGQVFVDSGSVEKGAGCPSGYHPNKSDYYRQGDDGSVIFIPKGHACVKNRRMNPMNSRAAGKAITRIAAGKRATAILGRVTIRKKK